MFVHYYSDAHDCVCLHAGVQYDIELRVQDLEERLKTITANQQRILDQLEHIFRPCRAQSSSPYATHTAGIFPQLTPNQYPTAHQSPTTPVFRQSFPSTSFHDTHFDPGMTDPDLPALEHDTATGALSKGPEPFGLHHTYMNSPLPSSAIAKDSLRPIEEVLNNEPGKEILLERAGTVCQKLAREAIFGSEIMRRCTPAGSKDLPALPKAELYQLKTIMFQQLPSFWRKPDAFEKLWKDKCWKAIEQACKRQRTGKTSAQPSQ